MLEGKVQNHNSLNFKYQTFPTCHPKLKILHGNLYLQRIINPMFTPKQNYIDMSVSLKEPKKTITILQSYLNYFKLTGDNDSASLFFVV